MPHITFDSLFDGSVIMHGRFPIGYRELLLVEHAHVPDWYALVSVVLDAEKRPTGLVGVNWLRPRNLRGLADAIHALALAA